MTEQLFPLVYTGGQETTFTVHGVGQVGPGGKFSVPGSLLLAFMRRGDVEHDGECPTPPCRHDREPEPEPEPEPDAAKDRGSGTSGKPKGGRRGASTSAQDGQDGAGE